MPYNLAHIDTGSTAWMLVSCALVLLMTPGLAFFYGGMVRAKNVGGMLIQNWACMAIVSLVWVLLTYSIAFGGQNGIWGGLHFALGHNLNQAVPGYTGAAAQVIPPILFLLFQLMFAIITPALITGSTADRWNFKPFVGFITLWSILVYAPVAHWVFSPTGFLFHMGAEDFAGGTVVHANAGAAAIAVALVLGKRHGLGFDRMKAHNTPFVMLGAALLWFGWFGFNAGSALAANQLSVMAFANTQLATAAAVISWLFVEYLMTKKVTVIGGASGAVVGLVAITPACGFVSLSGGIAVGLLAGALCGYLVVRKSRKQRRFMDDALDVGRVHLVGGAFGALLIGLFGDSHTGGVNGLFNGGGFSLLAKQAETVSIVIAYSFVVSLALAYAINRFWPMRMTNDEQAIGMDKHQHDEPAYELDLEHMPELLAALAARGIVPTVEVADKASSNGHNDHVPLLVE